MLVFKIRFFVAVVLICMLNFDCFASDIQSESSSQTFPLEQVETTFDRSQTEVQTILDLVGIDNQLHYVPNELYADVANKLSRLGRDSVPELVLVLRNAPLRSTELSLAVDAVCEIGDVRAIPALIELANSPNFMHHAGQFEGQLAKFGDQIVPSLVKMASDRKNSSAHGRRIATKVLIQLDSDEAEPFCSAIIDERDPISFRMAVDYFAKRRDQSIESKLLLLIEELKVISDEYSYDQELVRHAIRAIGVIGSRENSSEPLFKLLNDSESRFQNDAIAALGKLGETNSISKLIEYLGDAEPEPYQPSGPNVCFGGRPAPTRRDFAIQALIDIGDPATTKVLAVADPNKRAGQGAIAVLSARKVVEARLLFEGLLTDRTKDKSLRTLAARGLERIADQRSIPSLIDALNETPPLRLQQTVIDALVAIGKSARHPLLKLMGDENDILRNGAIKGLCKLAEPDDFPAIALECAKPVNDVYVFVNDFLNLAEKQSSTEIDSAIWEIASHDLNGCKALEILTKRENTDRNRLIPAVISALGTAKYEWQLSRLIELSRRLDSPQIHAALIPLCNHESDHIVDMACDALAQSNMKLLLDESAAGNIHAQALARCLEKHTGNKLAEDWINNALEDPELATLAIQLVFVWKWKPAGDQLMKILANPKKSDLHQVAINSLREIKDKRLIGWFLKDPDRNLSMHSSTISAFGKESTEQMIQALEAHPDFAISVLLQVRDRRTFPHLKKVLGDPRYQNRHFTIVTTLAKLGDDSAIDLLTSQFIEPKGYSSHFVWETLMKCPRQKTLPHLKRLLRTSKYELDAISQLGWMGTPEAIEILRRHFPQASAKGRETIEALLSQLGYSIPQS